MNIDCIRCGEMPGAHEHGYCGHCHWAVRMEIEQGMHQLRDYLARWSDFRDWELSRSG